MTRRAQVDTQLVPPSSLVLGRLSVVLSALLMVTPLTAEAGLWSLLGKAGKAGSKAGKVARVGAKAGKAVKIGAAGKAVAGIGGVVVAERAAMVFGGMGDDVARSAGFLARNTEGELVMVARNGSQRTFAAESLVGATDELGTTGTKTVYLDKSAATSREALASLPEDTRLVLVDEGKQLPVRRQEGGAGDVVDFVVETADGTVDLASYAEEPTEEGSDGEGSGVMVWFAAAMVAGGAWWLKRKLFPPAPVAA